MVENRPFEAADALSVAARQLQTASTAEDLLRQIVEGAVATIDACTYAGISIDQNGRPSSPVVSDPAALELDRHQYSIGNGPCLRAMRGTEVFIEAPDLVNDARFGAFGAEAARQGVHSAMAHRLYVDSQILGSLNLYSAERVTFTDDDRRRCVVFSALASLALNVFRLEADAGGLREALRSRDVIGQAKGILMEREDLSEDDAFERLRQMSQHQNRKLRGIAEAIVEAQQSTRSGELTA